MSKFWISKKKNSDMITLSFETEISIKDLKSSDMVGYSMYYKEALKETLKNKAIDMWIEKHGKELFDDFTTDEFLKEYKTAFMRRLLKG